MKAWNEPPPSTKPGKVVKLLQRPEGVTFSEIASKLKVRNTNARSYISGLRTTGCPILEREEEGRGRVFYVQKVDRRRKVQAEPAAPPPSLSTREYFKSLGLPYTAVGVGEYAGAAFRVAMANPSIREAIEAQLHPR
jgi:hypothetical protein